MNTITIDRTLQAALADHQAGKLAEAEALYRQVLAAQPLNPYALHLLGVIAHQVGQHAAAVDLISRAITQKADDAAFHSNLGRALRALGFFEEAAASDRRALNLQPEEAEFHFKLGTALAAIGSVEEAIACFRRALELKPDYADAHNNLGNVYISIGQPDEALACLRRAAALSPDKAFYQGNLVYTMLFHPDYDAETILDEHRQWAKRYELPRRAFQKPHDNVPDPHRRLKIGYVSPDLRAHPVGRFLLPLLEHHDHDQFEITAYAEIAHPDAVTERLRSCTDQWHMTAGWSEERLTEQIRTDGIDILVDLSLHTSEHLPLFARKPAPVQATYLAYPGTSGMEAMDYRLTDPYLDPPGTDDAYSETSLRLPETYWCYQGPAATPEVSPLPALSAGHVTFGCLNNFSKVNPRVLAVWASLLRNVPDSRLLLFAPEGSARERVREALAQERVALHHLTFTSYAPLPQYFANYGQADIALDPFPYAGGTTTCDALWMGVPVVSLAGQTAVGRGGVSILSNAGLPELVAQTEDDYVRIAAELAHDLPRLAELRATMRARMLASPLMDAPRFAGNVEDAYRTMWRTWCEGQRH